jgi:molybdate transport system substrate-binding protein
MSRRAAIAAVTSALVALAVGGCGSSSDSTSSAGGSTSPSSASTASGGSLTVFAAASLKKTFTEIGARFEAEHPGTKVTFSFAGSSDLVAQLQQGAPADVFASADTKNMDKVTAASLTTGSPVNFATNTLEIAVPPGNPATITSFQDLAKPGVKVVVCAPEVPCGAATKKVEQSSGVTIKPVSEEQSVIDVLGKVSSGEADAGVVYVTDVKGAGDRVEGVAFPESSSAVNTYPIVALKSSRNAALAAEFIASVTGEPGQGILAAAGFAQAP